MGFSPGSVPTGAGQEATSRGAFPPCAAVMLSVHHRTQPVLGSRNILQPGSSWHLPWHQLVQALHFISIFPLLIALLLQDGKKRHFMGCLGVDTGNFGSFEEVWRAA